MDKSQENLITKQPVVVIVGHIDHGKTSLLDFIRQTHLAEKETGGITQHIGAYEIEKDGKRITFIDTPGHEAFSAMRLRGAKVADIAILVVAADEGVKPQTKEAISHIKQAGIPMIIAINKADKAPLRVERVKDELAKEGVLVEDRGGKVPAIATSAKTGKGVPELLELILLVAEMEELKVNVGSLARGVVIESYLDAKRGPVATLLIESGSLAEADFIGTSSIAAKIKRMEDFSGKQVRQAGPSQPVLILGFDNVPIVGDQFNSFQSLEAAQTVLETKTGQETEALQLEPEQKLIELIIKTDVLGSIEPIGNVLANLPQEKVVLKIIKAEAGDINLSDLKMAESGRAVILGFRVKVPSAVAQAARQKRIKVFTFEIIYDLVEGIREQMNRILKPEKLRIDLAKLKTLVVFRTEKKRQIIGARVLEGEIKQGCQLEIFRPSSEFKSLEEILEEENVGRGKVVGLEKDKKEVERGKKNEEIGILFEGSERVKEGDVLVAYEELRQKNEI